MHIDTLLSILNVQAGESAAPGESLNEHVPAAEQLVEMKTPVASVGLTHQHSPAVISPLLSSSPSDQTPVMKKVPLVTQDPNRTPARTPLKRGDALEDQTVRSGVHLTITHYYFTA